MSANTFPGQIAVCASLIVLLCAPAEAHVTKIAIDSRSPAFANQSFGAVGPYEILRGRAFGEVDPADRHNSIIQDITLAPRNERGKVEYIATFTLIKPVDAAQGNRVLFYDVPNRGTPLHSAFNHPGGEPGDGFFYKRGYVILHSGWQGDLPYSPADDRSAADSLVESIALPRARNPDGSSITGPFLVRIPIKGLEGPSGDMARPESSLSYPPASFDTTKASLSSAPAETIRGEPTGPRQQLSSGEWIWAECGAGKAAEAATQPADLCIKLLKGAFDPKRVYSLVFTARDPIVLGLGFAATRDIVSFFRYTERDVHGNVNPIFGAVSQVISQGISQTGNFVKAFIHLGFNEDEAGRIVWDGANAHIGGRFAPVNFRFATPGSSPTLYAAGNEAILWWGSAQDRLRNKAQASMLDRCRSRAVCPKIFETFGSAELWNQRLSAGLVGTDGKRDIPLPHNVRRYYFPGTSHGGGAGGFVTGNSVATFKQSVPEQWAGSGSGRTQVSVDNRCVLSMNPNPEKEQMRALIVALTAWVVNGTSAPDSQYPTLQAGLLVRDLKGSLKFPPLPGVPVPYGIANPMLDYDFGSHLNTDDLSGYMDRQPPLIRHIFPAWVSQVDADGNEISGIASVQHQAPLGTYLGWNITRTGILAGKICGASGGFIPFANARAERLRSGDPRASIEERYGDRQGYVCAVEKAVRHSTKERFLLEEDGRRLIDEAILATSAGDLAFLPAARSVRGRELCAEAKAISSPR